MPEEVKKDVYRTLRRKYTSMKRNLCKGTNKRKDKETGFGINVQRGKYFLRPLSSGVEKKTCLF
jgi:hypothetical protein